MSDEDEAPMSDEELVAELQRALDARTFCDACGGEDAFPDGRAYCVLCGKEPDLDSGEVVIVRKYAPGAPIYGVFCDYRCHFAFYNQGQIGTNSETPRDLA